MKISVIIVSYNTKKLLKECLDSLFEKNKDQNMEVIVVDNASTDGSQLMVKKNFPLVNFLENKENLGFATGNNIGLRRSKGEYALLLNSDTRFVENSIEKMIGFIEKNPKVGIASCQLIYENGEIQPSGGFFPSLWRVLIWMLFIDDLPFIGKYLKSFHPHPPAFYTQDNWYRREHFQDWVTGAFFLIRSKVIKDVGLLDENYFMYVEEMEYCYRAKKAGWEVIYNPITKIVHLGGQSGTSKNALLGEYRGLKYFFRKHKHAWEMIFLRIFLKLGAMFRILLFGIIKGNLEAKEIYVEAFRIA